MKVGYPKALRRRTGIVLVTAGAAILALAAAVSSAVASFGMPVPSLLLDPAGSFSVVYLPDWGTHELELRHPDRIVAIDGEPIDGTPGYRDTLARRAYAVVAQRAESSARSVRLRFARGDERIEVEAPIRTLGTDELWWFFALYALMGLGILSSGIAVLLVAGRRDGARAYFVWSVFGYGFLVSFFDYHTQGWLAPLFSCSTVGVIAGLAWLACAFPTPVRFASRGVRWIGKVVAVQGAVIALVLGLGPALAIDVAPIRTGITYLMPLALLFLAAMVAARWATANGRARQELRAAALGLVLVPVVVAVGYLVAIPAGFAFFHLLLPFAAFVIPAGVGYSLVQHNVLSTTLVVSRRAVLAPVVFIGLVASGMVWWWARRDSLGQALPVFAAASTFCIVAYAGHRFSERTLFGASTHFRPTLEELSDRLASLRDRAEVRTTLEGLVHRWLPHAAARVVDAAALESVPHLSEEARDKLQHGQNAWTDEEPMVRSLLVPMRSVGELRAILVVQPKNAAGLYTSDDLALLESIAGIGALALHHADVVAEVDELRRLEVAARKHDKRLTLSSLGAELSHEVAYPLNYFRHLLERLQSARPVDSEYIEVGHEELARLSRMVASLRRVALPAPASRPIALAASVQHVRTLMRAEADERRVELRAEVPDDVVVDADPDQLLQLLANLVRNAIQATHEGGLVILRSRRADEHLWIEILDDGPGIPERLGDQVFQPWVTTKPEGTGLGLAVAVRIVRGFGWTMGVDRDEGFTRFHVRVPVSRPRLPIASAREPA